MQQNVFKDLVYDILYINKGGITSGCVDMVFKMCFVELVCFDTVNTSFNYTKHGWIKL